MRRAMTWVYCEPKSRMRIFECAGGAAVFTKSVRTCCWRFHVRIVRAIHRSECSFSSNATLKFLPRFLDGRLLDRISAGAQQDRARDAKEGREGFQALRIMGVRFIGKSGIG